ncbi:uncharacterized protein si:ch211-170d8.2 [Corythoichthys intestinalis]|uniref:uncharacterized protein si:ch211-170d8.2 n=1 Tax=Corythoichthys intestinalis TaxID=161448 RepID=UPI0025A5E2DC|nr:uncharacterized protein si:ch211-170d8.2 [Corythoichthys intestinalis]
MFGFRNTTMALTHFHTWIAFFLISVIICDVGGRALSPRSIWIHRPSLRTELLGRMRRGAAEAHRERCAELTASWRESSHENPRDNSTVLRLIVRPLSAGISRGSVFPERPLFSFVRRVYRCCQDGLDCRSVKGLQGRFGGGSDVELLVSREIFSMSIRRAELHLQLTNPQQVDIHPVLLTMAKSNLPTRFISRSHGNTLELRVDLLFLFRGLQEAAGGPGGGYRLANTRKVLLSSSHKKLTSADLRSNVGDAWGELGLALGCSRAGVAVCCESSEVGLLHTPFVALYYR